MEQNGVPAATDPRYGPVPGPSQGYVVAGMPGRVGAWLLDGFLVGLLSLVPAIIGIVTGAVTLNQQALDQIGQFEPGTYQPFSSVTVPILTVNVGLLVAAASVFIALHLLYYAGSWAKFGTTPAQRALKLRVADNDSGTNLSIEQALVRWLFLEGIATITGAVFLVVFLNSAATTPLNRLFGLNGNFGTAGYSSFGVTLVSDIVWWGSTLWLIVLAVSAGASSVHRGLHDRMVGSIVLRPTPAYPIWSGYGYPPQGMPYWPQGSQSFYAPPQQWPGYPPQSPYPPAPGSAQPPSSAPGPEPAPTDRQP